MLAFVDSVTGTAVYLNPDFVVSLRPDPNEPTRRTAVKLSDGESFSVVGRAHRSRGQADSSTVMQF